MILGVDIGGRHVRAGMVDERGAIVASRTVETPPDVETLLCSLDDAVRWLVEAVGLPEAVGVGCQGIIDPDSTRVEALPGALHFLQGLHLSELLALPRDRPVFADNDARAALAGEMVWGAARGHRHALMLTLGAGVGGAVLAEGKLLRGHTGVAGHLGHVTVDPDGEPCVCGNRGCLETVFSARAIEAQAWAAVHRGCHSTLTRLFRHQPHLLTCRTVFQAAEEGDELAESIVQAAVRKLGAAVAGLLHVFDPEIVILGGRVADAGAALLAPLRAEVYARTSALLGRQVPLVEQEVADRSGIIAAAALVLVPGAAR